MMGATKGLRLANPCFGIWDASFDLSERNARLCGLYAKGEMVQVGHNSHLVREIETMFYATYDAKEGGGTCDCMWWW